MTRFPNYFNHTLQEEAALEVHQFWPLVEINCADDLKLFLCSLYAPPCVHANDSLPPCRSLCRNSKRGCEPLMNQYGFEWPKRMACEQFPELEKGGASCLSRPKETVQPSLPSTIRKGDLSLSLFVLRDIWFVSFYWANVPRGKEHEPYPIQTRKTRPQHREVHALLFTTSVRVLLRPTGLWTLKGCETGPPAYRPYPRRLESLTICRCNYKNSTFSSAIQRPWVLVRPELNSRPPTWQPGAQPTEPPVRGLFTKPVKILQFWKHFCLWVRLEHR